MPTDDDPHGELAWRPGRLAEARALLRRALFALLGTGGERRVHALYLRVLRALGRFGPPEDATSLATLSAIAARSSTIIDVGANVGRYAWFLGRQAADEARLVALEPHPGAAALLRTVIGGRPGCTILELAASDLDGTAALVVPDGAFGNPVSGLAWVEATGGLGHRDSPMIQTRRLDGLIEDGSLAIRGPVLLKIDVEGGEARVLRGAVGLLRDHRPIIYFECQATSLARHGETPEGVWGILRQSGYRFYANRIGRFEPVTEVDPSVVNYLAIPDPDRASDAVTMETALDAWATPTGIEPV
jgi:FkbM family methyltransferase